MPEPFKSLSRQLKALGRVRDGVAAAELAIVVLPLMIVVVAVIEMGRFYQAYHVSDKALRDAARYLAQQDIDCPDGGGVGAIEIVNGFNPEIAAKFIALTGTVNQAFLPNVPGDSSSFPASPPASELLLDDWNDPNSITVTYDCLPVDNVNVQDDAYSGAFATEPAIPVVEMSATVPFTPMIELWSMSGFTVSHNQVGIGDQTPDP